jgi:hypothetical protein
MKYIAYVAVAFFAFLSVGVVANTCGKACEAKSCGCKLCECENCGCCKGCSK